MPRYEILIPKIIHQIWIGPKSMPGVYKEWAETWKKHHPDWEYRLWTNETVPRDQWELEAFIRTIPNWPCRTDMYKYQILLRHGGLYVDCDFECKRSVEQLLHRRTEVVAFSVREPDKRRYMGVNNSFIACQPGSFLVKWCLAMAPLMAAEKRPDGKPKWNFATGPNVMTLVARFRQHNPTVIVPSYRLHPYQITEMERRNEEFPDAYAIHHWGTKWKDSKMADLEKAISSEPGTPGGSEPQEPPSADEASRTEPPSSSGSADPPEPS